MTVHNIRQILANWIEQSTSQPGQLSEGVDPANWIAERFMEWWQGESESMASSLADAANATDSIRSELIRLGGWNNPELGETMHEISHLTNAIEELQAAFNQRKDDSGAS